MRQHHAERGIVADCAEITDMVSDALKFRHNRAQPDRPGRRLQSQCALHRSGEGQRVRDRTVTRHPPGQPSGAIQGCACHQQIDALVDIAETSLQSNHRFAIAGEAEMSRLDDSGMDWTHGNLVQRAAVGAQEGV